MGVPESAESLSYRVSSVSLLLCLHRSSLRVAAGPSCPPLSPVLGRPGGCVSPETLLEPGSSISKSPTIPVPQGLSVCAVGTLLPEQCAFKVEASTA